MSNRDSTTSHPGPSGRSPAPPTHISSSYRTFASSARARLSYGSAHGSTPATSSAPGAAAGDSAFLAALSPATARYLSTRKEEGEDDILNSRSGDDDGGDLQMQRRQMCNPVGSGRDETTQLRLFVQSALGIKLPNNSNNVVPIMTTPDPANASFYALALLSKTHRPDDAYLAARAVALKGEGKRAIWILDRAGLIGAIRWKGEADDDAPGAEFSDHYHEMEHMIEDPPVSNGEGIRNALLLRTEAALLAGQCLVAIGEHERALAVYEEAMRFPPPPPPPEWGYYGYGYQIDATNDVVVEEEEGMETQFSNEMYIRQWREQSLSHTALIDEGYDERLLRLAENVRPLPFSSDDNVSMMEGIHPLARLCSARGIAYDEISNPHRALPFLRMALQIDARCVEALDYVIKRRLLIPEEEREWVESLNWGDESVNLNHMGISWLRDSYVARLRGGIGGTGLPPSTVQEHGAINESFKSVDGGHIMDASSVHGVGLQTPSAFSLASPIVACGVDRNEELPKQSLETYNAVDQAFRNLAISHNLGKSSDILSLAAIQSYASHNLQAALTYCTVIDTLDPFCRTAGYVYVATLVALGLKRRLFQLAHRLVDADPKDALAWFAVGSYYHLCRRHELSQRHFSRSTRLDPSSAECWIGFGCSFAVCDESDQALASFRAAQNKYSGSHIPLLYMGMEYLRTNHLSLAGHFLASSQKTDPSDPLCCNELGVWSFRRGEMEDAAFWFVKALRLHVEAESSALTSTDEALGTTGYILLNSKASDESTGKDKSNSETPFAKAEMRGVQPPLSSVLYATKTPSGQSIAVHKSSKISDNVLTDLECIDRCKDAFWEPTIYNLGQSYRKLKQYPDAIVCFEKCASLNPGSAAAYSGLGFARHLSGDVDGAIESYHEALGRKPDDPFSTEMLNRALAEAVTYPKSSIFHSDMFTSEAMRQASVIGQSILSSRIAESNYIVDMNIT